MRRNHSDHIAARSDHGRGLNSMCIRVQDDFARLLREHRGAANVRNDDLLPIFQGSASREEPNCVSGCFPASFVVMDRARSVKHGFPVLRIQRKTR